MINDFSGAEAATYTGAGGALLLVIRILYKMLRRDFEEVKEADQKESILNQYKELAEHYKKEAEENAKRADMFAEERNRAIEELGKVRGEVSRLTGHTESLESKVTHLSQTIKILNKMCMSTNGIPHHPLYPDSQLIQGDDHE